MRWLLLVAIAACSKPEPKQEASQPMPSSIQLAARYTRCLHAASVGAWDDYARCHAANAVIETAGISKRSVTEEVARMRAARPQFQMIRREAELSLSSPKKVVAIEWLSATAARPIGIYIAHVVDFDDAGLITHDTAFFDALTLRGQLGEAVQATFDPAAGEWERHGIYERTGSAVEAANLDAYRQLVKHRNAHDPGFAKFLAPDYVATDYVFGKFPKDKVVAALQGAKDAVTVEQVWAVGDYVAAIERYESAQGSAKRTLRALTLYELKAKTFARAWFFWDRETYR